MVVSESTRGKQKDTIVVCCWSDNMAFMCDVEMTIPQFRKLVARRGVSHKSWTEIQRDLSDKKHKTGIYATETTIQNVMENKYVEQ